MITKPHHYRVHYVIRYNFENERGIFSNAESHTSYLWTRIRVWMLCRQSGVSNVAVQPVVE